MLPLPLPMLICSVICDISQVNDDLFIRHYRKDVIYVPLCQAFLGVIFICYKMVNMIVSNYGT